MTWAIVTGATARGGAAIANELHRAGVDVILHHSPGSLERAVAFCEELLAKRSESARTWEADFGSGFAMPDWLIQAAPAFCVCNASVYLPSDLKDSERAAQDMSVHLSANAALLSSLRSSLKSVVAVSDIHVERPTVGHVWYNVSKAALQALMLTLAVEWAPQTRCNVVAPGALPFPESWTDEERKAQVVRSIPLGRVGAFEELASAVKWLLLDAHYVTGHVLNVDGGRSRVLTD